MSLHSLMNAVPVDLARLCAELKTHAGIAHKQDIQRLQQALRQACPVDFYPNGDDAAVLPNGDGYQLLAMEGFINEFVQLDPWFAGWCGVMVNVSDIAAMGGRPLAVVNAVWGDSDQRAGQIMAGMAAASRAYQVPIVGGHSNLRCTQEQLSVAILGTAQRLLSSFAARPDHDVIMAVDLRGAYHSPLLNWNAATSAPAERLRGDIALLAEIAEDGLAVAAKDISQAGVLGTLMMLLESSAVGANIELGAIPRPEHVSWQDWLCSFPSYGYLLTTPSHLSPALLQRFRQRDISAQVIGRVQARPQLWLHYQQQHQLFWNLDEQAMTGMQASQEAFWQRSEPCLR